MSHRNVEGIPFDVVAFIDEHIHSVEQLEILLLLRRTAPRAWTSITVSGHLRSNVESADLRLRDLHARGLIACLHEEASASSGHAGSVCLVPAHSGADPHQQTAYAVDTPPQLASGDSLDATLGRLEEAYATRRTRVIELIFTKPPTALRDFADAFRLRRK